MCLAKNSRPGIAYVVNQCARFTHNSKESHATGAKKILLYLKGTSTKEMTIQPTDKHDVNCYADANSGDLWGSEDYQDPVCVKSRTRSVILFMGCPLLWVSKLQTQVALNTMES